MVLVVLNLGKRRGWFQPIDCRAGSCDSNYRFARIRFVVSGHRNNCFDSEKVEQFFSSLSSSWNCPAIT